MYYKDELAKLKAGGKHVGIVTKPTKMHMSKKDVFIVEGNKE
jgi:hypothetical protein